MSLALLYAIFCVKESPKYQQNEIKAKLSDYTTPTHLISGLKTIWKHRPNDLRKYLILMIICYALEIVANIGEGTKNFVYLKSVLEFEVQEFKYYNLSSQIIGIFALIVLVPIMAGKFGLMDSTIVMTELAGKFLKKSCKYRKPDVVKFPFY